MSNYIQGLLSKLRQNVFQMEIEAREPEEIKEVQECLDLASDEEKKIKNTYGYIITDKNSQLETSIYSNNTLTSNFYNNEPRKILLNLYNEPMVKVRKKFIFFSNFIGLLGLISVILTQIEYETIYYKKFYPCLKITKFKYVKYKGITIRYINLIICCIMEICCFFYNYYLFKLKYENLIYYDKKFFQTKFFFIFLIETIFILLHPFPGYEKCIRLDNGKLKVYYNFQTFFYSLNFLKVFFILRSLLLILNPFQKFSGIEEINICKITEEGLIFTIKHFKKKIHFIFK